MHAGVAAQARAATLIRVVAWWAEDPRRASRDEIVETLFHLDPGRLARGSTDPTETPNPAERGEPTPDQETPTDG